MSGRMIFFRGKRLCILGRDESRPYRAMHNVLKLSSPLGDDLNSPPLLGEEKGGVSLGFSKTPVQLKHRLHFRPGTSFTLFSFKLLCFYLNL